MLEVEGVDGSDWSRFNPLSPTNPATFAVNWNRTFVLEPDEPRGLAVLVHGLSDSPYSMRPLASILHRLGYVVYGLRVPGHGTVPGALTEVEWEDWRLAVRIVCHEVQTRRDEEQPFVLGGYSNGAALAVDYTLDSLDDEELPIPDRLIFLSPAFAVSKLAALAKWQLSLSRLPYLEKLAWNSVLPEYDPYKYNSFALNAARQIFRLTSRVDQRLQDLSDRGRMSELPPVLAIGSVVDATVPAVTSLSRWFGRLEGGHDELVIFDVNRVAQAEMFLGPSVDILMTTLDEGHPYPFELSIVGNESEQTLDLVERVWRPGAMIPRQRSIDLSWPLGVFSLSHVAIPFPPEDPIYGVGSSQQLPFPFGRLEARGENGVLTVPITLLMRLRYNPFFSYVDQRVVRFVSPQASEAIESDSGSAVD
ncbi:MAG: alpha/beta hydrolase [Acidobacteriota bacterium]